MRDMGSLKALLVILWLFRGTTLCIRKMTAHSRVQVDGRCNSRCKIQPTTNLRIVLVPSCVLVRMCCQMCIDKHKILTINIKTKCNSSLVSLHIITTYMNNACMCTYKEQENEWQLHDATY